MLFIRYALGDIVCGQALQHKAFGNVPEPFQPTVDLANALYNYHPDFRGDMRASAAGAGYIEIVAVKKTYDFCKIDEDAVFSRYLTSEQKKSARKEAEKVLKQ